VDDAAGWTMEPLFEEEKDAGRMIHAYLTTISLSTFAANSVQLTLDSLG
jgi:hypothetical protein